MSGRNETLRHWSIPRDMYAIPGVLTTRSTAQLDSKELNSARTFDITAHLVNTRSTTMSMKIVGLEPATEITLLEMNV